MARRGSRGEEGAVTAELALGLPLLVALTAGLVWMLAIGAAQVRVVDASREAARTVARGDDRSTAVSIARRIAPEGARVSVAVGGGEVRVTTTARVTGPGGLLASLPGVSVSADAVAVLDRLQEVGAPQDAAYLREAAAVQRLLSPAEMGELFKVLALARGEGHAWPGFAVADMRHRL